MNFLSYESAFMTGLRKATDYFLLGLLWLVASLGVVTFGAATTAMFYTAEKAVRKDEGKMFVTFWKCFRREFNQATLLWLLGLFPSIFLGFNALLLWGTDLPAIVFALVLVASGVCFFWICLWYGYLSRFKDDIKTLLGNTFRMVFAYLPWVALLAVVTAAGIAGAVLSIWYAPPFFIIVPGVYGAAANAVLCKVFKAFLPADNSKKKGRTASNSEEQ